MLHTITETEPIAVANRLRPVLLKIGRDLRREVHALGVTGGQVSLLVQIKTNQGIGVRELAALERMSPAGMSAYVERLVQAGLVRRTADAEDRRRHGLSLTPAGLRVLRSVKSRRTALLASRLRRLSAEELAAVEAAVAPLERLLEAEVPLALAPAARASLGTDRLTGLPDDRKARG